MFLVIVTDMLAHVIVSRYRDKNSNFFKTIFIFYLQAILEFVTNVNIRLKASTVNSALKDIMAMPPLERLWIV